MNCKCCNKIVEFNDHKIGNDFYHEKCLNEYIKRCKKQHIVINDMILKNQDLTNNLINYISVIEEIKKYISGLIDVNSNEQSLENYKFLNIYNLLKNLEK